MISPVLFALSWVAVFGSGTEVDTLDRVRRVEAAISSLKHFQAYVMPQLSAACRHDCGVVAVPVTVVDQDLRELLKVFTQYAQLNSADRVSLQNQFVDKFQQYPLQYVLGLFSHCETVLKHNFSQAVNEHNQSVLSYIDAVLISTADTQLATATDQLRRMEWLVRYEQYASKLSEFRRLPVTEEEKAANSKKSGARPEIISKLRQQCETAMKGAIQNPNEMSRFLTRIQLLASVYRQDTVMCIIESSLSMLESALWDIAHAGGIKSLRETRTVIDAYKQVAEDRRALLRQREQVVSAISL